MTVILKKKEKTWCYDKMYVNVNADSQRSTIECEGNGRDGKTPNKYKN